MKFFFQHIPINSSFFLVLQQVKDNQELKRIVFDLSEVSENISFIDI